MVLDSRRGELKEQAERSWIVFILFYLIIQEIHQEMR